MHRSGVVEQTRRAIASVIINCTLALAYQRAAPWGIPPNKCAEFIDWRQSIDRFWSASQLAHQATE